MNFHYYRSAYPAKHQGFSILEVISSAALLGLAITLSYTFTNVSEDVKSSSKLRNAVAEIVENDIEKFKSIAWGFLYNSRGTTSNTPCYRTSRECNQLRPPIAPDIFSMQRYCLDVATRFFSGLPNSHKASHYFYPDAHYHQIFQGRTARIRRSIQVVSHPNSTFNSSYFRGHHPELVKISYYLVTLNKRSQNIVLESFSSGPRPSTFFIRSYFLNLDAHAWCPSLT